MKFNDVRVLRRVNYYKTPATKLALISSHIKKIKYLHDMFIKMEDEVEEGGDEKGVNEKRKEG